MTGGDDDAVGKEEEEEDKCTSPFGLQQTPGEMSGWDPRCNMFGTIPLKMLVVVVKLVALCERERWKLL